MLLAFSYHGEFDKAEETLKRALSKLPRAGRTTFGRFGHPGESLSHLLALENSINVKKCWNLSTFGPQTKIPQYSMHADQMGRSHKGKIAFEDVAIR